MIKTIINTLRLLALALTVSGALGAHAQELNCKVQINSDKVQGTNKSIFNTLEQAINEYMNTNTFSQAQIAANEKIDCNLFLTVNEVNDDVISGDLQIQAMRPVYNSAYTTTTLNFKDTKVEFTYRENEPLTFSTNQMESQLTAILNFYAYLILAVDFDSFAPHGGEPFFDMLKQIVQWAQSSGESGWKAFEDTKNRSAVLAAYTDANTQVLRDLNYKYHRTGLDQMALSPDKGRAAITAALKDLKAVYDKAPMSVGLNLFHDAKMDELVNVYSKAPQSERETVYELLEPIYPTDMQRLEEIKKGKEKK